MTDHPTLSTIKTLLTHLDTQRFSSAVELLLDDERRLTSEPLTTSEILQLGLINWMTRYNLLTDLTRAAVVKAFKQPIDAFARHCDEFEAGDRPRTKRPTAGFTILDNSFVVMPTPHSTRGYYNVAEGSWTMTLPRLTLTAVTCDLSVLLMSLLSTMTQKQ